MAIARIDRVERLRIILNGVFLISRQLRLYLSAPIYASSDSTLVDPDFDWSICVGRIGTDRIGEYCWTRLP